jgi:hypothetical protein
MEPVVAVGDGPTLEVPHVDGFWSDGESSYQRAGGGARKLHFWDFLGISSEYLVSKRRAKMVHASK